MTELNLQRQEAPLRRLMGPGPLDVHPRVYKALSSPVIGYMDPVYLKVLDRIGELLPSVFGRTGGITNAMPGTGSSGMEAWGRCTASPVRWVECMRLLMVRSVPVFWRPYFG